MTYLEAVKHIWRHIDAELDAPLALERELVRYATLAPSSHNTQCWQFELAQRRITLRPDLTRRCPVADPDDHHLYVSLGCALQNLQLAAAAQGLRAEVDIRTPDISAIDIRLKAAEPEHSSLYQAIPYRQCTRAEYDGRPLDTQELAALEQAVSGPGVRVLMLTETAAINAVLDYVVAANTAQVNNPEFAAELETWLRFNDAEAVRQGDGLFARCSGNPTVPRWLGKLIFRLMFRAGRENDRHARQIRSSAGIAVFYAEQDDMTHWLEIGRCYERFALQATALGIRNAFINQPVEVEHIRHQLAAYLGLGERRPDLLVRFGRGPLLPQSLRRPLESVIVA